MLRILHSNTPEFEATLARISGRGETEQSGIDQAVAEIIDAVRKRGDAALCDYTLRFDNLDLQKTGIEVAARDLEKALDSIEPAARKSLELAAERIAAFHAKQKQQTWISTEEADVLLGQMVRPLDRVGIYVPGGKAAYPSSVLMNAVPAKVAGVAEVIMVVPMPQGEVNPYVLAAARIAGVNRVFRVGGAQAVAALAYGTESVPRVDKITGPGNIYVATAKKQVFGQVDIDMIAGPSEILVINDGSGNPAHLAADLLGQAEHDELASAVLVTTDADFGARVAAEVEAQLKELRRAAIAREALENYAAVLVVEDLAAAADLSNRIAPEHLELAVTAPFELLPLIRHAGAIFMGHHTPEAAGDYLAGPNHTLPTGGTARFFSPLSVDDFVKKSSLLSFSREGLGRLGDDVVRIAELEGLEAHARSVSLRLKDLPGASE